MPEVKLALPSMYFQGIVCGKCGRIVILGGPDLIELAATLIDWATDPKGCPAGCGGDTWHDFEFPLLCQQIVDQLPQELKN